MKETNLFFVCYHWASFSRPVGRRTSDVVRVDKGFKDEQFCCLLDVFVS